MAGFCQFLMILFMEFINIGPVSIREWAGGVRGGVGSGKKLKQRQKKTQAVEFKVAITYTCTHKGSIFHYKA